LTFLFSDLRTEEDACREVTIKPNSKWGGEGSLGCGIGYGYLHRIPIRLVQPESVGLKTATVMATAAPVATAITPTAAYASQVAAQPFVNPTSTATPFIPIVPPLTTYQPVNPTNMAPTVDLTGSVANMNLGHDTSGRLPPVNVFNSAQPQPMLNYSKEPIFSTNPLSTPTQQQYNPQAGQQQASNTSEYLFKKNEQPSNVSSDTVFSASTYQSVPVYTNPQQQQFSTNLPQTNQNSEPAQFAPVTMNSPLAFNPATVYK
jgi:GRASP55/65 PDZ-like domain